jgi:putative transposase
MEGKIKNVTLTKYNDRYFISIVCEIEKEIKTKPIEKIVALDLGIKHFAYSSDNKIIENPRFYDKEVEKLSSKIDTEKDIIRKKELQKRRKTLWFRNNNKKENFLHQITSSLVKEYDCIILEDLDIKNMLQSNNSSLNKQINTVSWNKFSNYISYKVEETGKKYVKVDPKNTTKMCSKCFKLVEKDLSTRVHKCNFCGLEIDRDYNASLNILRLGLQSLGENP